MFETLKPDERQLVVAACEIILTTGRASISSLQRRMRISYTAAAMAIDLLENAGVVGPPDSKLQRPINADKLDEALMPHNEGHP